MRYFYDENNKVNAIDENQEFLIKEEWIELTEAEKSNHLNPVKTPEQIEAHIMGVVQKHMDDTAYSWGYDDIKSAIIYIGDPYPTFDLEGQMFRNWRSAIWVYVNAEYEKLKLGQRTMPTDAELIAELPVLETYATPLGLTV